MSDTEQPAILKPEDLTFARANTFAKIYSNNVQIEASIWDVRLTFGDFTVTHGVGTVEQLATIVMSPQHAKALATVLTNNIAKYEQEIGAILLPIQDEGSPVKSLVPKKSVSPPKP